MPSDFGFPNTGGGGRGYDERRFIYTLYQLPNPLLDPFSLCHIASIGVSNISVHGVVFFVRLLIRFLTTHDMNLEWTLRPCTSIIFYACKPLFSIVRFRRCLTLQSLFKQLRRNIDASDHDLRRLLSISYAC